VAPLDEGMDEGIEAGVARYLREMDSVPGWFSHQDVVLFERIGLIQQGSGMRGDILEIGTYMGKSAILLGFLLGDYDSLVINDLFDGSASTADNVAEVTLEYPGLTQKQFIDRYMSYHRWKPEVVADLSSTLPAALGDRKFRLIHVDGSHTYEVVREDILNSRTFAGPDCIVVMDDWRTVHTPGVSAAVWEAVTREGLIPLVVSDAKFYAMWAPGPIGVGSFLRDWVRENYPDQHQSHWIAGHELVRLGTPPQPL
jgi:hypothetical protein